MFVHMYVHTQKEKFWTEGPMELKAARTAIAQWSLQRAATRVGSSKRKRDDPALRLVRGGGCVLGVHESFALVVCVV